MSETNGTKPESDDLDLVEIEVEVIDDDGNLVDDDVVVLVDGEGNVLATDETVTIVGADGTIVVDESLAVSGADGELHVVEEDVAVLEADEDA